jgi:ubiquinone/menaquinone biosynthesis C-methylase UbiE
LDPTLHYGLEAFAKEAVMPVRYRSGTIKRETFHTVSLLTPHVQPGASVLDIGCGEGYVLDELKARGVTDVQGVDIVDIRRNKDYPFRLYDGQTLPFPDRSFDLVVLSFVLHHVPNERKLVLIEEALRVSRAKVVIVEDTPTTAFDRLMNHRHGESYRRKIGSAAAFGFLTEGEWRWLFRGMGLEPEARPLSRFCRSILQPFARTAFVLRKSRSLATPA